MKPERLFLKRFISTFYEESRKRRTPKNASVVLTRSINEIFKKYFKLKYEFEVTEVSKAFKASGFEIMKVDEEEIPKEPWGAGNHLYSAFQEFINIKTQTNVDLQHSWKKHKENYSQEKINTIEVLRNKLDEFWKNNNQLMSGHIKRK